jgi:hypothetical protein
MKMKTSTGKKLRYGGISAAVTTVIIAAIILFNVIFSALSSKFTWYADLTPDLLFTLSDECIDLIRNGDDEFENSSSPIEMVDKIREENRKYNAENSLSEGMEGYRDEDLMINLIFCDDPDVWQNDTMMNYVYNTATELQSEFPEYISIKNPNIVHNPSSVTKYKENSLTVIDPTSVIIEFGTEYRIRELASFFGTNTSDGTIWAYDGEKAFAASILSVTRVESPLACVTVNHREGFADTALLQTLSDAGYKIDDVDLKNEEIPEDCRLLVIFDPKDDFLVKDGTSDIDEIDKIDKFLDATNSMMVFVSPETPVLKNLEEYLSEWGIKFDRHTDAAGTEHPYMIKDSQNSLTSNGFTVVSEYVTDNPVSAITKDMRSRPIPQSVIFPNAMSISHSDIYSPQRYVNEEDATIAYNYAAYSADGISRAMYNLFTTSATASAFANGSEVEKASEQNKLALMTISKEDRTIQESNYTAVNEASYVVAFGSTDFASKDFLHSNAYGNTDLLLSVCRHIGREPVPVGLGFKPFADFTIDTVTTKEATQYTVVLAVVPVLAATVAGIVVLVRRKHR